MQKKEENVPTINNLRQWQKNMKKPFFITISRSAFCCCCYIHWHSNSNRRHMLCCKFFSNHFHYRQKIVGRLRLLLAANRQNSILTKTPSRVRNLNTCIKGAGIRGNWGKDKESRKWRGSGERKNKKAWKKEVVEAEGNQRGIGGRE